MKKLMLSAAMLLAFLCPSFTTRAANSYGLPDNITDGNILHCFSWPMKYIIEELPNIAAAGFGSIQISPLQRPDIDEGWTWYTIYLPYDYHAYSSPGMGSREDLRTLCSEAEKYGIKIIVDVALNHVNRTEPYYNPWWKRDGFYRTWGSDGKSIDYNSRYSITHDPLGDYVELNTENADAITRAKAFMEELRELGVKGIRFDAAKHIELPSETNGNGNGIWPAVTSVEGLFYYGEIVGECVNGSDEAIREYAKYIWVPDNMYSTYAARENGGVHTAHAGGRDEKTGGHVIYWAESHDDYSNDEWSERLDQSVIDRSYCGLACRNTQAALYYSRPRARGKDNIKIEKGSTAFMSKQVVEVNKFRNAMVGRKDYFTKYDNNAACCVTRENGGAVIITNNPNTYITIENGGGYCPPGIYNDRVSGNQFTVESDGLIKGIVGPTGVAIIYKDEDYKTTLTPVQVTITGSRQYNVAYAGNFSNGNNYIHYWNSNKEGSGTKWPGVPMERAKGSDGKYYWCYDVPADCDHVIFNNGTGSDAMQTADLPLISNYVMDNGGATIIPVKFQTGSFDAEPAPAPKSVTIEGDYNVAFSGNFSYIHYWNNSTSTTWPGVAMTKVKGSDGNDYWCYKLPEAVTGIVFNNGHFDDATNEKTADLGYSYKYVMCESGASSVMLTFTLNGVPINPKPVNPNPEKLEVVWPDNVKYCYFYNKDNWAPHVWAWISESNKTNCGRAEDWPGDAMTKTPSSSDNKYFWKASNNSVGKILFNNNGDTNKKTGDLDFINGATYFPDGGYNGGDGMVNSNPDKLYLFGTIEDNIWNPMSSDFKLSKIDKGIYIAYNITFDESDAYFNFATDYATSGNTSDDQWANLNSKSKRYGAPYKDTPIQINSPAQLTLYENENTAACQSWQAPSGTYDIIVDLYDMTVTLKSAQPAPTVEALQLAEVQKSTAAVGLRNFDYISYPPASDGSALGVTIDPTNGDVVSVSPVSVADNIYRNAFDAALTKKVLVTTTFTDNTNYNLEAMTATIGKKQNQTNTRAAGNTTVFRGITLLGDYGQNEISSKVNYYHSLKQVSPSRCPCRRRPEQRRSILPI